MKRSVATGEGIISSVGDVLASVTAMVSSKRNSLSSSDSRDSAENTNRTNRTNTIEMT